MGGTLVSDDVTRYVGPDFVTESPALLALRRETAELPNAGMQLGIEAAGYVCWLARLIGARRTIEVGTFTGYSALAMAQTLPADGRIVACDISEEWTTIARRHWQAAGVADKIDLRVAPAVETLDALLRDGAGLYDLALIDADKTSYDAYYERCLRLLRRGGVMVFDNVLWSGAVARGDQDTATAALHALNQKVRRDRRVDASLITVGDGLLLARKG
jgi:predicted O-methyltransferase YrrM